MYLKKIFILFIILPIIFLLAPGCGQSSPEDVSQPTESVPEQQGTTEKVREMTAPVTWERAHSHVKLEFSHPPRLGESTSFDCTIWADEDFPDNVAAWIKAESLNLKSGRLTKWSEQDVVESMKVDGTLSWEGSLKANTPASFSGVIRFPEEGDWIVRAYVGPTDRSWYYRYDSVNLYVSKDEAMFGHLEDYSPSIVPIVRWSPKFGQVVKSGFCFYNEHRIGGEHETESQETQLIVQSQGSLGSIKG